MNENFFKKIFNKKPAKKISEETTGEKKPENVRMKTPLEFGLVEDPENGIMVTPEELKEKRESEK